MVLDGFLAMGVEVVALCDPKYEGSLLGVPQRGAYDPALAPGAKAVVAIGNNATRRNVAATTQHEFTNFIHPSATVSGHSTLGIGCMIMAGAIVQVHARIGNHVIVNTGASVDHDGVVGDYVHIAPGAVLCGRVKVGEGTLIGAGAVVLPGVTIGAWATIGAGAVVIRDVRDGATVAGNPAREIRSLAG